MNKRYIILLFAVLLNRTLLAQNTFDQKKFSVNAGFLHGGGSLLGVDLEAMLGEKASIQAGAGMVGYGFGFNVHIKPTINSSYISLQYWHQGVGESFAQSLFGPSFVFRAKRLLTAQIGWGFTLDKGPAWPINLRQPDMMLTYAFGFYFPF